MKFKPGDRVIDTINRRRLTVIEGFESGKTYRYLLQGRGQVWSVSETYLKLFLGSSEFKYLQE